jgi:hypothetical protein
MGDQGGFENQEQEGHRSLFVMFRGPVRVTDRSPSLAELETPDIFLNLLRVG